MEGFTTNFTATCLIELLNLVHTKQLLADEESLQFSHTRLTNARTFTQQQLSSASNTDLAMMSKQVIQQLETIRKHKFKIVDAPLWEVSLSEDNPLNSRVESLSADDIANSTVYQPTNPALLGKNIFSIHVNNVPEVFKLEPVVTVTLSSGDSCPVNITPLHDNSWSVKYFITRYPQSGGCGEDSSSDEQPTSPAAAVPTVKVSVETNDVQARDSPMELILRNELAVGTRVDFNQ